MAAERERRVLAMLCTGHARVETNGGLGTDALIRRFLNACVNGRMNCAKLARYLRYSGGVQKNLGALRGLNIEIGKVENERNAARAKATELETAARDVAAKLTAEHPKQFAAEHQKRNELEQQLSKEKEKHQITAQKLLEARGKQRESDEHLSQLNAKVTELSASVERERALREQSLIDLQGAHEANVRSLQQHVLELTSQLENATAEWRHTDRQYEALHREMLAVLDQRDQARQELDAIKQRLGPR
jgi:chromosome segregation ATPase